MKTKHPERENKKKTPCACFRVIGSLYVAFWFRSSLSTALSLAVFTLEMEEKKEHLFGLFSFFEKTKFLYP